MIWDDSSTKEDFNHRGHSGANSYLSIMKKWGSDIKEDHDL
jgi:hypothetical protein